MAVTMWTFVGKVTPLVCHALSVFIMVSFQRASFNFMAAVTICIDFGAQENKVCHCFHCFHVYLP